MCTHYYVIIFKTASLMKTHASPSTNNNIVRMLTVKRLLKIVKFRMD